MDKILLCKIKPPSLVEYHWHEGETCIQVQRESEFQDLPQPYIEMLLRPEEVTGLGRNIISIIKEFINEDEYMSYVTKLRGGLN